MCMLNLNIEFLEYKDVLLRDVEEILDSTIRAPYELKQDIIKMIEYNCVGGKMIRGLFAVYSAYAMCSEWNEEMKKR